MDYTSPALALVKMKEAIQKADRFRGADEPRKNVEPPENGAIKL